MKITEDFIGNETKALTKTKISTIVRWWGFDPDSYSTWGDVRSDMNNILSESSSSMISDRERASSFLSKINYINDTDSVIGDMLFANNEPGVWYDPSDLSTLFQDSAGTTPVTAVEQPVGLMLDKSGRGNHASQPTATSRPVLSARVNQYLATETLATQNVTTLAAQYRLSFEGTGTVTLSGTATGAYSAGSHLITCTAGTLTGTVSGSVTKADLRVANTGAGLPAYQRVNTATDYDTVGFPHYLRFDGVDDHLNLGVLNMSAASSAGYFGAITKLSDVSSGRWYSHGLTTANGSVRLLAPANNGQASVRTGFYSSSGLREVGGTAHAAPITLTLKSEIEPGGEGLWITHNNGNRFSTTVDPTVFSADGEACIGAQVFLTTRANFFNGHLYSLIVTGRKSSISELALIESFLRRKSRAY